MQELCIAGAIRVGWLNNVMKAYLEHLILIRMKVVSKEYYNFIVLHIEKPRAIT